MIETSIKHSCFQFLPFYKTHLHSFYEILFSNFTSSTKETIFAVWKSNNDFVSEAPHFNYWRLFIIEDDVIGCWMLMLVLKFISKFLLMHFWWRRSLQSTHILIICLGSVYYQKHIFARIQKRNNQFYM